PCRLGRCRGFFGVSQFSAPRASKSLSSLAVMKFSLPRFVTILFFLLPTTGCLHRERGAFPSLESGPAEKTRATFAQKITLLGISDVGKVNDHLYRGSQPNSEGIRELRKLGVTTIVNLRGERQGAVRMERRTAAEAGIKLVNIHASGWSPPT